MQLQHKLQWITVVHFMKHPLIKIISQSVSVLAAEEALILSYFKRKQYKRNEILLHEGDVAQHVFFVEKGGLHLFYADEAGNDRSCNFVFENEFITDLESFSKQTPATCFIKSLMPSICYAVKNSALIELMELSPATKEFFRVVVENVANGNFRRTRSLQSATPEKRFLELMEQRPDIFQRVPQRFIAQYVGIAPESLSRIKKRLLT